MNTHEVLKLALEALELNNSEWKDLADSGDSGYWKAEDQDHYQQTNKAITAIKEALAQPEQEPVFLIYDDAGGWIESNENEYNKTEEVNRWLLYTTPPKEQQSCDKRPWVGLTHEQTKECVRAWDGNDAYYLCRAIESKLEEKNT